MGLALASQSEQVRQSQNATEVRPTRFREQAIKIYTKTGDEGSTGLIGGNRVSKDDLAIDCFGALDELNTSLGSVRVQSRDWPLDLLLKRLQSAVFEVGSEIASPPEHRRSQVANLGTIVEDMERSIDIQVAILPELKNFILPGGCELASRIHLARVQCRNAERAMVRLNQKEQVRSELLVFINRLSDWLFVAARTANSEAGTPETTWVKDSP